MGAMEREDIEGKGQNRHGKVRGSDGAWIERLRAGDKTGWQGSQAQDAGSLCDSERE
jgi:hypothetical protein